MTEENRRIHPLPFASTQIAIQSHTQEPHYIPRNGHHVVLNPPPVLASSPTITTSSLVVANNVPVSPFESPLVFSDSSIQNASPSVAFSNLSLRTPQRSIPKSLPPLPRLSSSSTSTPQSSTPPVRTASLSRLSGGYKQMLNQKKKAQQAHAHGQMLPPLLPASAVPGEMLNSADDLFSFLDQVSQTTPLLHDSPVVGSGEPTIEELLGAFMSPTTPFLQHPLTSPSQPSPYDPNSYLPTPRSVYSSVGPSPDIVNIPGTPNNYTSPALQLLEEVLPPDAPLFPEASPVSPAAYLPTKTIDPRELPFLAPPMSRNPSSQTSSSSSSTSPQVRFSQPIVSAPPKQSSSESPSGQSPQAHLRHTGYRKGVQSVDLVPFDAPIQPRSYITPSATSRKDLPPSVTKSYKKRGAEEAGLPETSELRDQDDLTQSLLEHVQSKRLANTLAARRSRARKLQTAREQEERIQQLTDEVELWKKRAEELEQMLRQGGMM